MNPLHESLRSYVKSAYLAAVTNTEKSWSHTIAISRQKSDIPGVAKAAGRETPKEP